MLQPTGQITVLESGPVTLHSFMAPAEGDMVCSQVIETESRSIIVDAQLLLPYAQALRAYVERLGKPIDRVIVSHAHPDHWCGLQVFADLPLYATPTTQYVIANYGQGMMDYKRSTMGERSGLLAERLVVPSNALELGSQQVDGVELVYRAVVDAEAPEIAVVELPQLRTLIAQDVVYNRVYPAVGEKNQQGQYLFDGWVAALRELQAKDYQWILPGHGEPCDPSVIPGLIEYIQFTKQIFESGVKPEEFKARVIERYPDLRVPELLDFSLVFLYFRTW
jgi:glyoxylase-like metal-dependent hydrolase (beta-lactamase superfamily II)